MVFCNDVMMFIDDVDGWYSAMVVFVDEELEWLNERITTFMEMGRSRVLTTSSMATESATAMGGRRFRRSLALRRDNPRSFPEHFASRGICHS